MKRTVSTALAEHAVGVADVERRARGADRVAAVADEDLELVADRLRTEIVHFGARDRQVVVGGCGGHCSGRGQLLADLPEAGRRGVVERGVRRLHSLALDEVLAGDAVEIG